MKFLLNFCFLIIFHSGQIRGELGCRDEYGELIDWFYLYKLPKSFDGDGSGHTGMNYLYITPETETPSWTLSELLMNDSTSMPGLTLAPAYEDDDTLLVMYSDQPPGDQKVSSSRGHTKGVVMADESSGFWLIHSVPNYPPPVGEDYDYPATGRIYAQSFLCISVASDQLDKIGRQLQYNELFIYSNRVPDHLEFPSIAEALEMKSIKSEPFFNIESLQSRDGVEFTSFAKSKKFQKELYEDLVAPAYNPGDFYVESWRHGRGNIESDCKKESKVYNILGVSIESFDVSFTTNADHSKWMVRDDAKSYERFS